MALNKEFNSPLRTLISVDMATSRGKISQECVYACEGTRVISMGSDGFSDSIFRFQDYATTMRDIEKMGLKSKKEADKILQDTEPVSSCGLCVFHLLSRTELTCPNSSLGSFHSTIPLDQLQH